MTKKPLDKESLQRKYADIYPRYEKLGRNLKEALETFLNEAGIDVLGVTFRIKDFESFWEKVQRKGYTNPFQEIEDICGLRIISFYPSNIDKISQIINKEFVVKESMDKADLLDLDRFGYRSFHFTLTIKKGWLKAPNYRGLDGLKAEVQVRTILMHAWADFEQKLAYKKKDHIPPQFTRQLYQLSALFENADGQFDALRKQIEEYRKELLSEEAKKSGRFDVSQQMNLDSFQALLDFYFSDRVKTIDSTRRLLDDILKFGVTMENIVEGFEKTKDILPLIEKEVYADKEGGRWAQVGIVRVILDLTNPDYFQSRKGIMPESIQKSKHKWIAKISNRK